jgi:hypothetical protein
VVLDASAASGSELVPELRSLVRGKIADLLDGDPPQTPERSFLALRNRLAHGGGVTHAAASRLVATWEPRVDELFASERFWAELFVVTRRADGSWAALRGPEPAPFPIEIAEPALAVLAGLPMGRPALVRGMRAQFIWPIVLHGVPRGAEDTATATREVPQIYSRRGEVEPRYTPIGSDEITESSGDAETARELDRLMEVAEEEVLSVRGFEGEIRSDASVLVGRAEERARIAELLCAAPGGVHWIPGPAGAGKSLVLAGAIADAIDRAPEGTMIFAFRFRAGDPRCARSEFLRFANERLESLTPGVRRPGGAPLDELRHRIRHLDGARVVLVLDGLDEIAERDPTFAREVPLSLREDGITWVCAGRAEKGLGEAFALATSLFEGGSFPLMSDTDVRAMILERLGRARTRLIANDRDVGEDVTNAFVEAVCERAAGVPIYVHHVVCDLLARRLRPDPERIPDLPASLAEYHQRIVDRIGVGSLSLVATPIVMTFALAHEPLSAAEVAVVLSEGWDILSGESDPGELVQRALSALESVLRRQGSESLQKYALFHHSFREHLRTSPATAGAFRTARNRLTALVARSPSAPPPLDRYLLRWSVQHLLERDDDRGRTILRTLLERSEYLTRWARVQHSELVFDDLVAAHAALLPKSPVPGAVLAWLASDASGESVRPPERVHAWLVYRQDLRLYDAFLELARDQERWSAAGLTSERAAFLAASYQGRLANLLRRHGQLVRADKLLRQCAAHWEQHREGAEAASELSRVLYDRGYVAYLRGVETKAREWLKESAAVAASAGNEVAASISRCVEASVAATFGGAAEAARFLDVLEAAMPVFERQTAADPNAERWVQNVLAHRIEAAVRLGDAPAAEQWTGTDAENVEIVDYH